MKVLLLHPWLNSRLLKIGNELLARYIFFFLPLLSILGGCVKKGEQHSFVNNLIDQSPAFNVGDFDRQQIEARLNDVSIPLNVFFPEQEYSESFITFFTQQTFDELSRFYELEMEAFGWRQHAFLRNITMMVLVFEKPAKYCAVIAEKRNEATYKVSLIISAK